MTNDVEQIILKNEEQNELTYAENKAYMLYKEIWKFLINIKENDFNMIRINFSYNLDNNFGYINKSQGITYTMFCDQSFFKWHNYYEGCTCHYINLLFNTNIDMQLFFKLIADDGFYCDYLDDANPVLVCIDINKNQIEKRIQETLLKNKILKK